MDWLVIPCNSNLHLKPEDNTYSLVYIMVIITLGPRIYMV